MQNIRQKIRSVLNIFQVVGGWSSPTPLPHWHDVGAQNALVTRGLNKTTGTSGLLD